MLVTVNITVEICTNPLDLMIYVTRENDGFHFAVSRGNGGEYKTLISSSGPREKRIEVIGYLKQVLEKIIEDYEEMKSEHSTLTTEHVQTICYTLGQLGQGDTVFRTSEYLVA